MNPTFRSMSAEVHDKRSGVEGCCRAWLRAPGPHRRTTTTTSLSGGTGPSWTAAGDTPRPTSPRSTSRRTAASTSPCIIDSTSTRADRLLDVACGSGLAVELASVRGATCAGIDASARLLAVARDRAPDADLRVGDMCDLPWDDDTFDVATSFRGVWATTPEARRRDPPRPAARRAGGHHGVGSHQAVTGRMGARPAGDGGAGEGGRTGGDGLARQAGRR